MKQGLENRIHCVGASGAGMLPLTMYLKACGYDVSAEDDDFTETALALLGEAGVAIESLQVSGEERVTVVRSSAVLESDLTIRRARENSFAVLRRGECLAALAQSRKVIAVAGSHGKTTTTAMLIDCFAAAGVECSFLLGGSYADGRPPFRYGDCEWLIIEVDESDGTIDLFAPEISLVLNVDYDHHSYYSTEADYRSVFLRLISRTRGRSFVCPSFCASEDLDEQRVIPLGHGSGLRIAKTGSGVRDLAIENERREIECMINRSSDFNASNAAFALRGALEALPGVELPRFMEFSDLARRQSCHYLSAEYSVYEDYAHHPGEIEAMIAAIRQRGNERLVIVFQSHRFSRTARLKVEIAKALEKTEKLYLLPVYAASEEPLAGGEGIDLCEACVALGIDVRYWDQSDGLLFEDLLQGDFSKRTTFLFLGAGKTDRLARKFAELVASRDDRWGDFGLGVARSAGLDSSIIADEPLANKTTLRVGGVAERFLEPNSEAMLRAAIVGCCESGSAVRLMGRGSNLIVIDGVVSGLVVRLNHPFWKRWHAVGENKLWVGAGVRIKEICGAACKLGLAGFEFLEGIPGNLGGALRMNAGAMGGWTFDVVESVRFMTMDGEIIEKRREELDYGYRSCEQLENAVALGALLVSGNSGQDKVEIRKAIDTYQEKRHESQPREPSAGCIFKNPDGDSAGRIIDQLGLKGTQVGGAAVSQAHGNFIINTGQASSEDVIELVKLIRREAMAKKQIELEPEALLYGGDWNEVL